VDRFPQHTPHGWESREQPPPASPVPTNINVEGSAAATVTIFSPSRQELEFANGDAMNLTMARPIQKPPKIPKANILGDKIDTEKTNHNANENNHLWWQSSR